MLRYFSLLTLLVGIFIGSLYGQTRIDQTKINQEFDSALNLYNAGFLDESLAGFEKIINTYKLNTKTTASYFFEIKVMIDKKQYEEGSKLIHKFIEDYPTSKYVDEIRILATKINLESSDYYNALKELAFLIQSTNSVLYKIEAKELGGKIAENYLKSYEIKKLTDTFTGEKVKPYLMLLLAKAYLKEHDLESGLHTLSQIMLDYIYSDEYAEAKNLYQNPVTSQDETSTGSLIGVLLPLQYDENGNPTSTAASEILAGIKFSVSEYNEGRSDKIGIVVRDTKNDVDQISKIKDELGNNSRIKAILGPIFSNETRITAEAFNGTDLTILSPTATDDDLTSVSMDFFQANPPLAIRGKIMAQYIFFVENKRAMAVLNSIDGYSPLLAATFVNEFEKIGGKILTKVTYKSNSYSLSEQIKQLEQVQETDSIEGIYVPLTNKNDAIVILSQLGQDSLYIPLYGNQDWFTAKGFESSPELSNMLTFSSDYFIDYNDDGFKRFSERFSKQLGKDPSKNVLYGYDNANYLLTVMRNIVPSRTAIRTKMLSGFTTNGLHNNISFDENRTNRFLNIIRYKDGVFELIDKFRSSN
jgi:branched-chain amino acid transport system substrate-binding protein